MKYAGWSYIKKKRKPVIPDFDLPIGRRTSYLLNRENLVSVACPQKQGIAAIKLDEEHWTPITSQAKPAAGGNLKPDNYAPGQFTGGTQPTAVGEPTSNYAPASPTSPSKAV
jgi:hypothetical protein